MRRLLLTFLLLAACGGSAHRQAAVYVGPSSKPVVSDIVYIRQHQVDVVRWNFMATSTTTTTIAPTPPPVEIGTAASISSHSPHSEAWWHGVAICEQGGQNDSYFGYFSYMDGSAGGGKSWAEQVAMGNRTIAQYGDGAWAVRCVAAGYAASPSG